MLNNTLILMTAGDMSQSTVTSNKVTVTRENTCFVQARWSGTPVGVIKIQVTALNQPTVDADWVDFGGTIAPAGTAAGGGFALVDAGYAHFRVVYTRTSGSGTLELFVSEKGAA